MTGGAIIVLSLVLLVLLGGLVALGIGHRNWNWATVAAAVLVLLSAACYVYLAARVASRELAWRTRLERYEADIARTRDALRPSPTGGLAPIDGEKSLAALRADRDRWKRGLDRVDTWKLRSWHHASFRPPADDSATGTLSLAPDGNAKDKRPIGEGARLFLFDGANFEDGGRYVGEFVVTAAGYDDEAKRHVLTVAQTAPRDPYDAKVLSRAHDDVTVFESLPVDRWLAFYQSQAPAEADGASLPATAKQKDSPAVRALGDSAEVSGLVKDFVESFERHDQEVPEDEWPQAAARLQPGPNGAPPEAPHGTYWADVEFDDSHAFPAAGGRGAEADEAEESVREYLAGDRAEFDLQTALDLQAAKKATIKRVVYRRRLIDPMTMLSGADIGGAAEGAAGIRADGLATLMRLLRAELKTLEQAEARLVASQNTAKERSAATRTAIRGLEKDLTSWERDVTEATKLREDFQRQLEATRGLQRETEGRIVALGRELRDVAAKLTAEIDRVAPPPRTSRAVSVGADQP
jgi:hypothetical protein